jgi:aspartyl-tRNA(Asn)/glutamyl-tRNA(Gln) amidotransferase subunit B
MNNLEAVIGLEIHAQLATDSKLFCRCSTAYGAEPNTQVCPVCLGLPGALPVTNTAAMIRAMRAGMVTHCRMTRHSYFERKNYFYPDCPKNYQITQYRVPLCSGGYLVLSGGNRRIRITRIHVEEDAGKLIHDPNDNCTLVDMNRSGVPLIEIVSEPDIRTPAEAREYMRTLRDLLRYIGVCAGNMEQGNLRCDANVSLREKGSDKPGVKTEIKNLNSFRFVQQALEFEIDRQTEVIGVGKPVTQATMLWDSDHSETRPMRTKEDAHDYRYFPDPDLLAFDVPYQVYESIIESIPELPETRTDRFKRQLGLPAHQARLLMTSRKLADYFESVSELVDDPVVAGKWVTGELLRELNRCGVDLDAFPVEPADLAELINLTESGRINLSTAKDVFGEMVETGRNAPDIIASNSLEQITDEAILRTAAQQVIADNPELVARYKSGQDKLLKYFVGQIMTTTGGKADPRRAEALLTELLDRNRPSG